MFLELMSIPDLDVRGGALMVSHIPWRLPLPLDGSIRENVLRAIHQQRAEWNIDGRYQLVIETTQEWFTLLREGTPFLVGFHPDERRFADWLGIERVVRMEERDATPLELSAAQKIREIANEAEARVAKPPARWKWRLADETARANLARAAELAGVTIVACEEGGDTWKSKRTASTIEV